ncbi:MOSC domain-containing protein [Vulgatibacter sp.]|uniref:MOSC domain-containing protein n=1 Tax=Vulgatibacter sp. TaxID=1971226 RepID=UPI0035653702
MIGVLERLWRYPVKSMQGECVERLPIDGRGAVGDRLHAVRDEAGKFGSGKDTRRFRRIDGLFRFRARYEGEVPVVGFPDGRLVAGDDPRIHEALSRELGLPVTLAREEAVSHLDAGPLHLVTTSGLEALGLEGRDEQRFRPNLVVRSAGAGFVEEGWIGRRIRVGEEVVVEIAGRTERCVMVGFPQAELPAAPGLLRKLAAAREACFGVYARVVVPGVVRVGDRLRFAEAGDGGREAV